MVEQSKQELVDVKKQREELVLLDAATRKTLKEIEDEILRLLAAAEGNILDDEVLIKTLANSKVASNEADRQLKEIVRVQGVIQKVRDGYVPVAVLSSRIFFCIADLSSVDPMYQPVRLQEYVHYRRRCPDSHLHPIRSYAGTRWTGISHVNFVPVPSA